MWQRETIVIYSLPKADLLGSSKQTVGLGDIANLDQLIVDDDKRDSGEVIRERRETDVRHLGFMETVFLVAPVDRCAAFIRVVPDDPSRYICSGPK
jgi:hypothetical protein